MLEVENTLQELKAIAGTNLPSIMDLGNWMNAHGRSQETVAWIETLPNEIQTRMPVPLLTADALIYQRQWDKLEEWLRDQQWHDQEYMRLAMIALAARNQDDEAEQAVRQAEPGPWRGADERGDHHQLGRGPATRRQDLPQQPAQAAGRDQRKQNYTGATHSHPARLPRLRASYASQLGHP